MNYSKDVNIFYKKDKYILLLKDYISESSLINQILDYFNLIRCKNNQIHFKNKIGELLNLKDIINNFNTLKHRNFELIVEENIPNVTDLNNYINHMELNGNISQYESNLLRNELYSEKSKFAQYYSELPVSTNMLETNFNSYIKEKYRENIKKVLEKLKEFLLENKINSYQLNIINSLLFSDNQFMELFFIALEEDEEGLPQLINEFICNEENQCEYKTELLTPYIVSLYKSGNITKEIFYKIIEDLEVDSDIYNPIIAEYCVQISLILEK